MYISNFQKPMTEKIAKGEIFSDPSFASVSCARTGPITIADNIAKGKQGEEKEEFGIEKKTENGRGDSGRDDLA